jgi:hypothetical protein
MGLIRVWAKWLPLFSADFAAKTAFFIRKRDSWRAGQLINVVLCGRGPTGGLQCDESQSLRRRRV